MLIDDKEAETLMLMLGYGQRDGFTDADFAAVMHWAEEARMNEGILQVVLDASMSVCVQDGEVLFKTTPKGDREVEAMIEKASPSGEAKQ